MSPRAKRIWICSIILALGLVVGAFVLLREAMVPLNREILDEARDKWERAEIDDYEMVFTMADGEYAVRVHAGRITSLTRDGQSTTTHRPMDFTVDGLFDTLERELEAIDDPASPLGGDARTTLLRVRFNPEFGYVERYVRVVGGTGRSNTIVLKSITANQAD